MKYSIALISLIFLLSCNDKPAATNDPKFQEELKSREVKKVSDGVIIDAAMKKGNFIADTAQKTLAKALQENIAKSGIAGAIKYCNLNAYPIMEELEKEFDAKIRRVSYKYRNPDDKPDELEKELLDAYDYQVLNKGELSPNIQRDGEYLLYTKPIVINNGLCLSCHGEVGKYLSEEDFNLIKELYPEDKAHNYQMNELRGMWSIRLSKKELIKDI